MAILDTVENSRTVPVRDVNGGDGPTFAADRTVHSLTDFAQPSAFVAGLFDGEVFAADLRGTAESDLLYPAEQAFCDGFADKRRAEFAAGRLSARRALAHLGITDFPIAINPDRSPRWPAGVVGSISHTTGYACAVVARESAYTSIGVDVELCGRVTPDLDHLLFTSRERQFLDSLDTIDRAFAATIVFSAKEAFYKCQYVVTHQWLDFHDVSVELATFDLRTGSFQVQKTDEDRQRLLPAISPALSGRFHVDGELVATGIALREYRLATSNRR